MPNLCYITTTVRRFALLPSCSTLDLPRGHVTTVCKHPLFLTSNNAILSSCYRRKKQIYDSEICAVPKKISGITVSSYQCFKSIYRLELRENRNFWQVKKYISIVSFSFPYNTGSSNVIKMTKIFLRYALILVYNLAFSLVKLA